MQYEWGGDVYDDWNMNVGAWYILGVRGGELLESQRAIVCVERGDGHACPVVLRGCGGDFFSATLCQYL